MDFNIFKTQVDFNCYICAIFSALEESKDILSKIEYPEDLRKLSITELKEVCDELRQFIINEVSENPGHLGANLGVVELTVALHYVFDTPNDKIIWDVGHQAYGHKILTGRRKSFSTNRKYHGISGFPRMKESEYDSFGAGHSSISISAALGMAVAMKLENRKNHVIAVIGDGAMTGGEAYEGLNNAGITKSDILVILNDNNIAIDQNVGAMKEYLLDITTSKSYNNFKDKIWRFLGRVDKHGRRTRLIASQIEAGMKSTLLHHSNMFEALKFRYFGPIDGHDIDHLVRVLQALKDIPGPKLLHCKTIKGKGFKAAEDNQVVFHAPGKFDPHTGDLLGGDGIDQPATFQEVFGKSLFDLAKANEKIVAVTPAMPTGSALTVMMHEMPDRTFDVGIAEQHAVTFSAGMATQGLIPYCCIYSSFMQRSIDQAIHEVAIQNLHVVFCIDRAGLVGHDGATHHGFFDMAFFRSVPNFIISAPMDGVELRNILYTAQLPESSHPFVIRYPRSHNPLKDWEKPFEKIEIGKARRLSEGTDIAILTIGTTGNVVKKVVEKNKDKYSIEHWDMRFVSPLDEEALRHIFKSFKKIITVEDGILKGGFGSAVIEFMSSNGYASQVKRLGIPDYFVEHGTRRELMHECGFDEEGIEKALKDLLP